MSEIYPKKTMPLLMLGIYLHNMRRSLKTSGQIYITLLKKVGVVVSWLSIMQFLTLQLKKRISPDL